MRKYLSLVTLMAGLAAGTAHAAGTPANTQIKNQASATYVDASNVAQRATSNEVVTIVTQVPRISITPNSTNVPGNAGYIPGQEQVAVAGATVVYPYTLTNPGNGTDSYALTTQGTGFDATYGIKYYVDTNKNGFLDADERVAVSVIPNVAADGVVKFFMEYRVPTNATGATVLNLTPVGTSQRDITVTDGDNYHRTTVSQDAVLVASKEADKLTIDPSAAAAARTITYTISVTNTGAQKATNIVFKDDIRSLLNDLPAGSTVMSATGDTTSVPSGAVFSFPDDDLDSVPGDQIQATIPEILPSQTIKLTFKVLVPQVTNRSIDTTADNPASNTATVDYQGSTGTAQPVVKTNAAEVTVATPKTLGVTLGYVGTVTAGAETQSRPGVAGAFTDFTNVVRNDGNVADSFDLTFSGLATNFPIGTFVQFLRPDGTDLPDTNNDGKPETDQVAAGGTFTFITRIVLPNGAPSKTTASDLTVTATSRTDGTKFDPTIDSLSSIVAPTVIFGDRDIDPATLGGNDVLVVRNVAPGTQAIFPMDVGNVGGRPDNFNLSGSVTFTLVGGGSVTVPVTYFFADAGGNPIGTAITNTGTVAANAEARVVAVVNVPANAAAGTVTLSQTAVSPLTGASDTDGPADQIAVKSIYNLDLSADRAGTITSPGTQIYTHTLTNTGNVALAPSELLFDTATSGSITGWSTLYSFDGLNYADTVAGAITAAAAAGGPANTWDASGSLAAGGQTTLYVKVNAPAGLPIDATNTLRVGVYINKAEPVAPAPDTLDNLRPTVASASYVTDTSKVVSGKLSLKKWVDNCGSGPVNCPAPRTYGDAESVNSTAKPGDVLQYTIIAKNLSTEDLKAVVLTDVVPANTTLMSTTVAGLNPAGGTGSFLVSGAWGTVTPAANSVAGTVITAGVNTAGSSAVDESDILAPAGEIRLVITVRVN